MSGTIQPCRSLLIVLIAGAIQCNGQWAHETVAVALIQYWKYEKKARAESVRRLIYMSLPVYRIANAFRVNFFLFSFLSFSLALETVNCRFRFQ